MSFIGDETYISANWFIPQIEGLVFSLARADLLARISLKGIYFFGLFV